MIKHNDFLGRPLDVGDFVVFMRHGVRQFKLGKIKKFARSGKPYVCWQTNFGEVQLLQQGYQLVKVEGPDLTFFLLSKPNQS